MRATAQCSQCHREKPLTEFYKDQSTRRGFCQPCKDCKRTNVLNRVTRRAARLAEHPSMTGHQCCSRCQVLKPLSEFPRLARTLSGYTQPCKSCKNLLARTATQERRVIQGVIKKDVVRTATTQECRRCHEEKPLDAFSVRPTPANPHHLHSLCKPCEALRSKERRAKNPEAYRLYMRTRAQVRRAADPEAARIKDRAYYRMKPANAAARSTRWRQKHPGKRVAAQQRRKARQIGLPDTFTTAERAYMLQYWGFACAVCGRQEGFDWMLADDHWIPLGVPGCPGTVAVNMLPLCHSKGPGALGCNNLKHNFDPHTWLVERFGTRKAAKIERAIAAYFAAVAARVAS